MKKLTTFNEWITSIKENEVAIDTSTTSTISTTPTQNILNDVDTIINSLETLANELTEELKLIEDFTVEEGAGDFIKSWLTSIKAAKAQQKVNKIKMNAADLEFAADRAEGDKKQALKDKLPKVKLQADELQKMVDDRFSGKGGIVDSRIAKEKIKGQLEIIKRTSGMEDDPNKKADLKTKMKELANRMKEEDQAISDLEDKNGAAIEAEKERLRKEAEKKKEPKSEEPKSEEPKAEEPKAEEPKAEEPKAEEPKSEEPKAEEPKSEEPKSEEPKSEEPKAEEPKAEEPKAEEPKAEENPEIKKIKDNIKNYQDAIDTLEAKDKKSKDDLNKIDMLKNAISSEQKRLERKQSPKESLFISAIENNLYEIASDIWNKQDWQFENNSALYLRYSNIIKLEEYNMKLNEGYSSLSIKEKFSRLL